MSFVEKAKEAAMSKTAEMIVASIAAILLFVFYQISPYLLEAIDKALSPRLLLALLALSFVINLFLLAYLFGLNKNVNSSLFLRFGLYWDKDKNPYCPLCQKPVSTHNFYGEMKNEYYCKPCNHLIHLTGEDGQKITRKEAIDAL